MTGSLISLAETLTGDTVDSLDEARAEIASVDAEQLEATANRLLSVIDKKRDTEERRASARGLATLARVNSGVLPSTPTALVNGVDDADRQTRMAATVAVRELEPDVDQLYRRLTSPDVSDRRAAIRYYDYCGLDRHELMTETIAEAMADRLTDTDDTVRRLTARFYRRAAEREHNEARPREFQLQMDGIQQLLDTAIHSLCEATTDDNPRVALHSSFALYRAAYVWDSDGHRATATEALGQILTHEDEKTRRDAKHTFSTVHPVGEIRTFLNIVTERNHHYDADSISSVIDTERGPARRFSEADVRGDDSDDGLERGLIRTLKLHTEEIVDMADQFVERGWTEPNPNRIARFAVCVLATKQPEKVTGVVDGVIEGVRQGVGIQEGLDSIASLLQADVLDDATSVATDTLTASRSGEGSIPVEEFAAVVLEAPGALDSVSELERAVTDESNSDITADDRLLAARALAAVAEEQPSIVTAVDTVETILLERVFDGAYGDDGAGEALVSLWHAYPERIDLDSTAVEAQLETAEPISAIGSTDTRIAETGTEMLCDALGTSGDESPSTYDVLKDLHALADVAPEEVASVLDHIVANRPSGRSGRKEFSQLLSVLASHKPSAVVSHTDVLVGLQTDENDETREAAAIALRQLASAGYDLPFGLEQLAQSETDDDAWPMGVVAEVAPELARQLLRTSLVSIDSSNTDQAELLIKVSYGDRELARNAVEHAVRYANTSEYSSSPKKSIYTTLLANLATREPELVEEAIPVLIQTASNIYRGDCDRTLAEGVCAVCEQYPDRARRVVDDILDEEETLVETMPSNYQSEFERAAGLLSDSEKKGDDQEDPAKRDDALADLLDDPALNVEVERNKDV